MSINVKRQIPNCQRPPKCYPHDAPKNYSTVEQVAPLLPHTQCGAGFARNQTVFEKTTFLNFSKINELAVTVRQLEKQRIVKSPATSHHAACCFSKSIHWRKDSIEANYVLKIFCCRCGLDWLSIFWRFTRAVAPKSIKACSCKFFSGEQRNLHHFSRKDARSLLFCPRG